PSEYVCDGCISRPLVLGWWTQEDEMMLARRSVFWLSGQLLRVIDRDRDPLGIVDRKPDGEPEVIHAIGAPRAVVERRHDDLPAPARRLLRERYAPGIAYPAGPRPADGRVRPRQDRVARDVVAVSVAASANHFADIDGVADVET